MPRKTKIEKESSWARGPLFTKYYANVFGVTRAKSIVKIDFGNEMVLVEDGKKAYVADGQLILDFSATRVLRDLLSHTLSKIEKEEKK
ncbi:MAG: hypothetical protein KAW84_06315 [Thermoplasmata archaeon]|nr:hypothetical protein [Thermoplasmata archaeon]